MSVKPTYEELEGRVDQLRKEVEKCKLVEERLRESEKRYRSCIETSPDMIFYNDVNARVILANEQAAKTLGYKDPEEMNGLDAFNLIAPADREKAVAYTQKTIKEGYVEDVTYAFLKKDGTTIPGELSCSLIRDEQGNPSHFMIVARDITERKKSEEKYQALFENNPIETITVDHQGRVAGYNLAKENSGGRLPRLGDVMYKDYAAKHKIDMRHELMECINSGESKEFSEQKYNDKYLFIRMSPFIGGAIITSIDMTDRKLAEETLRDSREKYRTVLETNPDPVVVYDREGKVLYMNPAFTQVFGWTIEEQHKKKMDVFVPEDAWPETRMMIEKVIAGESFSGIETTRHTKAGDRIHVSISGATYRDKEGNFIGSVVNLRDISKQKMLESQLRRAQKMEAIGTLAGGIAHDFNNILGIIMGNAELAIDDVPEWNPARECLEEIRDASLRAKDVVRQILSFSRHSLMGRKHLRAGVIIKESLKLLRSSIPSTIDIRQNLSARSDTVLAEPTHINQILMNLCTNAYQAMSDKGGTLTVSLTNSEIPARHPAGGQNLQSQTHLAPGKYLVLNIKDTGHGIDPEIRERIFNPYFTTKKVGEGTGMGLAVVDGIVQKYDGGVEIDSTPGKGTSVTVYLPNSDQEPEEEVQAVESLPRGTERILFVDDEAGLVRAYSQALKSLGYDVVPCTNPDKALEIFKKEPENFDLVITDMTMPEMTGDKLAKALNTIRPNIPIIICSGFSNLISEDEAKALGIAAFSAKPLVKKELAKVVRRVLG